MIFEAVLFFPSGYWTFSSLPLVQIFMIENKMISVCILPFSPFMLCSLIKYYLVVEQDTTILSHTNAHTPAAAVKVYPQNLFPFILGVVFTCFLSKEFWNTFGYELLIFDTSE